MKKLSAHIAQLALASLTFVNMASAAETLCSSTEKIYFSCNLGEKILSLCATPDLSSNAGNLQYRFGKSTNQIELVYPKIARHPKLDFKEWSESSAKAGTQALGFKIGSYSYGVFTTRSVYGFNGSGLTIGKSGKRVTVLRCEPKSVISNPFYEGASELEIPKGDIDYIGSENN